MVDYTKQEILQFVQENDVKFIRLAFCDIFGTMKNISILASELQRAFDSGISFDASVVNGFMDIEESDLLLFPDPQTLEVLPWRPQQGRVARLFCEIYHPDGRRFAGDSRYLLQKTVAKAKQMGYSCQIGSECEFYLFEMDEHGQPTKTPHDRAGYLDIAPLDKGENVRREICLTLEEMGIPPESSHHEQGPGQNEIDFRYADALTAADQMMTFKSVVKAIAARNGLFASFLPKPLAGYSGSGMHINMSLKKQGVNIFSVGSQTHSEEAEQFIAGIMQRLGEITLFLNPLTNSYARFGQFEAPKYITWSHQNRSQSIRIPAAHGEYARMELRSADPSCNPYIAFTLLMEAGLMGISQKEVLEAPANFNVYQASAEQKAALKMLPDTLEEAIAAVRQSAFVHQVLPKSLIDKFTEAKIKEWEGYLQAVDKERYEQDRYFVTV